MTFPIGDPDRRRGNRRSTKAGPAGRGATVQGSITRAVPPPVS
jgi:hypothetical protein